MISQWSDCLGAERRTSVQLSTWSSTALSLALDQQVFETTSDLPIPWHWLYFGDGVSYSDTDVDGHPKRGNFFPPITFPRRMFAGARLNYHIPIDLDGIVHRIERIKSIQNKVGRSGPLVILTLDTSYEKNGEVFLSEERDIVYRDPPSKSLHAAPSHNRDAIPDWEWQIDIVPNEILLFRYSALTYNSHRIHYDRSYATEVKGYPDLLVQGPLIATLLCELVRRCTLCSISKLRFKSLRPTFVNDQICLRGNPIQENAAQLIAFNISGHQIMIVEVEIRK